MRSQTWRRKFRMMNPIQQRMTCQRPRARWRLLLRERPFKMDVYYNFKWDWCSFSTVRRRVLCTLYTEHSTLWKRILMIPSAPCITLIHHTTVSSTIDHCDTSPTSVSRNHSFRVNRRLSTIPCALSFQNVDGSIECTSYTMVEGIHPVQNIRNRTWIRFSTGVHLSNL